MDIKVKNIVTFSRGSITKIQKSAIVQKIFYRRKIFKMETVRSLTE